MVGMMVGAAVAWLGLELPYLNWRRVVPPVDTRPLVVRSDAKGHGAFLAPRSGERRHHGVDLAAPLKTPVLAIQSGVVAVVGTHRGLGRFVEVEHRGRCSSRYAHLEEIQVRPGMRVRQGEQLGTVGKTGNARHPRIVPHLHLEVLKDGEPIDPGRIGLEVSDLSGRAVAGTGTDRVRHASTGAAGSDS
jgi:murein DD-endopeptidase MepM/ murein hydrolase activator NlpD